MMNYLTFWVFKIYVIILDGTLLLMGALMGIQGWWPILILKQTTWQVQLMVVLRKVAWSSASIGIDGGGEFNHIEEFMNHLDDEQRCFRGKSVHNVRIERHWRDTREKVLDKYIETFRYFCLYRIFNLVNVDIKTKSTSFSWCSSWVTLIICSP